MPHAPGLTWYDDPGNAVETRAAGDLLDGAILAVQDRLGDQVAFSGASDPAPSGATRWRARGSVAMRVAYLGPEGTFTHETLELAAERFGWQDVTAVPYASQDAVAEAVAAAAVDLGIVAVATSLEGAMPVAASIAALPLQVIEAIERVCHYQLLALPGARLDSVRIVLSNPKALADCRSNLRRLMAEHTEEATASTAAAVRRVAAGTAVDCAAVGTAAAGRLYGLTPLVEAIEDDPTNWTRWAIIRRLDLSGPTPV